MNTSVSRSRQERRTTSVGDRVRALVKAHYGGSVNRAAKTLNIPQPTLRRIIKGFTQRPRVDLLSSITALHPDVTVEWLLNGSGPSPLEHTDLPDSLVGARGEFPERAEWNRLVRELELSEETRDALEGLLRGPFLLLGMLVEWQTDRSHDEAFTTADRASHRAWVSTLRGAVDAVGVETVRAKLRSMSLWLRLGPTSSALAVLASPTGTAVKELLLDQEKEDRREVMEFERQHPTERGLARTNRILSVAAESEARALVTPRIQWAMKQPTIKDSEITVPESRGGTARRSLRRKR
jgi:hypothetical protein